MLQYKKNFSFLFLENSWTETVQDDKPFITPLSSFLFLRPSASLYCGAARAWGGFWTA